jgi:predicted secreted protein
MKWTSALAIYTLLWVLSAFFVLPFHGRRAADDDVPLVKGQDPGAPATFRPGRILLQMTILGTVAFTVYYLAYTNGWADPDVFTGRK